MRTVEFLTYLLFENSSCQCNFNPNRFYLIGLKYHILFSYFAQSWRSGHKRNVCDSAAPLLVLFFPLPAQQGGGTDFSTDHGSVFVPTVRPFFFLRTDRLTLTAPSTLLKYTKKARIVVGCFRIKNQTKIHIHLSILFISYQKSHLQCFGKAEYYH